MRAHTRDKSSLRGLCSALVRSQVCTRAMWLGNTSLLLPFGLVFLA